DAHFATQVMLFLLSAGVEQEGTAKLNLVATGQPVLTYRLAIDIAAIGAIEIAEPVGVVFPVEPRMLAGDFGVVKLNVVGRNPSERDVRFMELVTSSLVSTL